MLVVQYIFTGRRQPLPEYAEYELGISIGETLNDVIALVQYVTINSEFRSAAGVAEAMRMIDPNMEAGAPVRPDTSWPGKVPLLL